MRSMTTRPASCGSSHSQPGERFPKYRRPASRHPFPAKLVDAMLAGLEGQEVDHSRAFAPGSGRSLRTHFWTR